MLCISLREEKGRSLKKDFKEAQENADLIELRLDLLSENSLQNIPSLIKDHKKPLIFCLRSVEEGGNFFKGIERQKEKILHYLTYSPDYIDLDWFLGKDFFLHVKKNFPKIKIIGSRHYSEKICYKTEIEKILCLPANFYKICVSVLSIKDTLEALSVFKKQPNLIGICSDYQGRLSRIASSIFNSPWSYASLKEGLETGKGQLTYCEMKDIYNFSSINSETKIYALIGNEQTTQFSIGHICHNEVFKKTSKNCVYVKLAFKKEEISYFFSVAYSLGFRGASVTKPFKESCYFFVNEISPEAKELGFINTIVFLQDKIIGSNSDGEGAKKAIEDYISLKEKKILILGAGGAATAIVSSLFKTINNNTKISLFNRTHEKALKLKEKFPSLEIISDEKEITSVSHDILINTVPFFPFVKEIRSNIVLMDIDTSNSKKDLLREYIKTKNIVVIPFTKMFLYQAVIQQKAWFSFSKNHEQLVRNIIRTAISNA